MLSDQNSSDIDHFDLQILDILSKEGRIPITALAKRINLSKSPCQVRFNRLCDEGYILGFRAVLNPQSLKKEHVAFTEVKLSNTTEKALTSFNEEVWKIPEVEQCHLIAGSFDYLLKVRTRNIRDYRRILGEAISALPYVSSSSTHVAMQSVKDSAM